MLKPVSRAAQMLRQQLSPPPPLMSRGELAERLNISPQAISSWINGTSVPEAWRMAALEEILGIPMRDWMVINDDGKDEA